VCHFGVQVVGMSVWMCMGVCVRVCVYECECVCNVCMVCLVCMGVYISVRVVVCVLTPSAPKHTTANRVRPCCVEMASPAANRLGALNVGVSV